jgi:putative endonuclease
VFGFTSLDVCRVWQTEVIAISCRIKTLVKNLLIFVRFIYIIPLKMSEILSLNIQNKHSFQSKTSRIGQLGEELAARFLLKNGFHLVLSNFKVPVGRNRLGAPVSGEIDLIAFDEDVLCFVEVKTRSSEFFAAPIAAVDLRKQRQITRTARMYRKIFRLDWVKFRYDVVSIVLNENAKPKIEIFKGFWNENKFRKKFWTDEF